MRQSALKVTALAMLLVVFAVVVITGTLVPSEAEGWADKPAHSQISQSIQPADADDARGTRDEGRTAMADGAGASGPSSLVPRPSALGSCGGVIGANAQDRSISRRTDHLGEAEDKGPEPPDNSKYVYGNDDVE